MGTLRFNSRYSSTSALARGAQRQPLLLFTLAYVGTPGPATMLLVLTVSNLHKTGCVGFRVPLLTGA
jgi:hypothetical protein